MISKPLNCSLLFDTIMETFGKKVTKAFRVKQNFVDPTQIREQIGGSTILLAEDNSINQQVAVEILTAVGLNVDIAANGLEAINKVLETPYDLVLMDIQMPEMDGYTATGRIRNIPRFKDLPIIAMTAHAMSGDREKCLAAGMNDYVTKPIDKKQLFRTLIRWVEQSKKVSTIKKPVETAVEYDLELLASKALLGIDITEFLIRINYNYQLLFALLQEVEDNYSLAKEEINAALESNGIEEIESAKRLIHSIKGMAGNISANELQETAHALEKGITNQDSDKIATLLIDFEQSLDQILRSIALFRGKTDPSFWQDLS